MKFKFLLSLFFLVTSLYSSVYPQTFSQLATPLYSSVKPFNKYKDIKSLSVEIQAYERSVKELILMGFKVDKEEEKKNKIS